MKLKPVVVVSTVYNHHRQNRTQQIMLLKALKKTQNPKELQRMLGLKKLSEVYRTMDKLAMNKEFHKELFRLGVDFGWVIEGMKKELDAPDARAGDRINVYKTFMKSMGVDSYTDTSDSGGGDWQEALKTDSQVVEAEVNAGDEYDVTMPEMPPEMRQLKDEDESIGHQLYG